MKRQDEIRLRHMLDEAKRVQRFIAGRGRADLDSDDMFAYAVTRALEIIGEAASRVSPELREELADIPWRNVIGMRNVIVHAYTNVSHDIIWQVATVNLPDLIVQLSMLLPDTDSE